VSGEYAGPSGAFGMRGIGVKPATRSKRATDDVTARKLWDVSEGLTHVTYDFAAAKPAPAKRAVATKAAPVKKPVEAETP
jgi:hypothetical protein